MRLLGRHRALVALLCRHPLPPLSSPDSRMVWSVLAVPRLERIVVSELLVSSGLCIVRHSRSMEDLEQRL